MTDMTDDLWDDMTPDRPTGYGDDRPRCHVCSRRDHRPGTFDGHWYVAPDGVDAECVRCGELTGPSDRAEVADGLVHASCMNPDEPIA